jgi:hypothetical protein
MNCLYIPSEGKLWSYLRHEKKKENSMPSATARAQCLVTVSSTEHGGRQGRWGEEMLVGAGETGGGRRGECGP